MSQKYIEIREPGTRKLLCKYDPKRHLLEFKRRDITTTVDLTKVHVEEASEQPPARRLDHRRRPS